jgi:acetolactate synthase-1/2/3 large subunit
MQEGDIRAMPQPTERVADGIATTLAANGVRFVFGIPGNDVLELIRACSDAGITFTLAKSEPSAAFMADAVTQVTGKPAACIFALGPGIANGVSGIAGAMQERSPVIVLGGEMAGNRREIYNHQAFDHVGLMRPVTKYAAELNPQRAGQQTARAVDIAMTHPRGPVFLNCPADSTRGMATESQIFGPAIGTAGILDAATARSAQAVLDGAKRPLALIGRGALHEGGPVAVKGFIEARQMPFFATYKAKGVLSEHHPLCLGAIALSPVMDDLSLGVIREADAIVLIGFDPIELRDAWLDAWPSSLPVLTLDYAPQSHRIFPIGQQLIGDVPAILGQLMPSKPSASDWSSGKLSALRQRIAEVVRPRQPASRISPAALFHAVSSRVTADMLMTVDVGAHRILANHVVACVTPGQLLQSNGLGCMGYAIPAAIGATLASRKPVIAMLGDGCALMSLGELAVIVELNLPVVTIVLVDEDLALIDLKQSKMNMTRQAVGFRSPDFAAIARGFGMASTEVDDLVGFDAALVAAMATGKPHLIAAKVDPSEYWDQM